MDDLERRPDRDGQGRRLVRPGEAARRKGGLAMSRGGERRVALALEATLGDPRRFAVAEEGDRPVQARRDDRRGRAGELAQRSPPRRMVQRSMRAS